MKYQKYIKLVSATLLGLVTLVGADEKQKVSIDVSKVDSTKYCVYGESVYSVGAIKKIDNGVYIKCKEYTVMGQSGPAEWTRAILN